MSIVVVGLNHKTAPLNFREKVAFTEVKTPLRSLMRLEHVHEGCIISTCNRVELCVATQHAQAASQQIEAFMAAYHGYDAAEMSPYLYRLQGREAIHHTFRVASSLDSMVVGEPQILGQIKEAYFEAKEANALGPVLHRFYHKAFGVAKRVRSETRIGEHSLSVGSVAVDLSKKIFDRLDNKVVLLVGAGEMIEIAAARLLERGVTQFYIANRSQENVIRLTHALNKNAHFRYIPLDRLKDYLKKADMIFVSTASPTYLLTQEMMTEAMRQRKNSPVFCIDISVPRNVEPAIDALENVYLYDIDDLEVILKENSKKRASASKQAESIVAQEADHFYVWLSSLKVTPTLKSIRQKIETIRKEEMDELWAYLPHLSSEDKIHIEKFSKRFCNKILHDPFLSVREEAKSDNPRFIEFLRKLFKVT